MSKLIAWLGDQHRNTTNTIDVIEWLMATSKPDVFFQVGDFGCMGSELSQFLHKVNKYLVKHDRLMYFIDGNHENHKWLRKQLGDKEQVNLTSNIIYLKRGTLLKLYGLNILCMGGAYSIDRAHRKLNKTYWLEETITDEEVDDALRHAERIDVLACHDVPDFFYYNVLRHKLTYNDDPDSSRNRQRLQRVFDAHVPPLTIHGHYHLNYNRNLKYGDKDVTVIGLNCDNLNLPTQVFLQKVG